MPSTKMVDSGKQRYTFHVSRALHPDEKQLSTVELLYTDFQKLKDCKVSGKELRIKYVFGCKGRTEVYLVNLFKKDTRIKVDGITKEALGALSEATPWETREGEKFLQGTKHKAMKGEGNGDGGYRKGVRCRHGSANCASGGATCTLERRALEVFGDSHGTAYLLGPTTSDLKEFSYSRATGLVLASILSPPQRMERPQIVVISSPLTLTSRQQETAAARKVFPTKPEPELPTTPEALARTPDVAPSLGSCERHAAVAAVMVSQTEQHRHAAMSTRHLCSAPQPSAATPRRVFHPSPAAKFRPACAIPRAVPSIGSWDEVDDGPREAAQRQRQQEATASSRHHELVQSIFTEAALRLKLSQQQCNKRSHGHVDLGSR